jgi:hypothetical protein
MLLFVCKRLNQCRSFRELSIQKYLCSILCSTSSEFREIAIPLGESARSLCIYFPRKQKGFWMLSL